MSSLLEELLEIDAKNITYQTILNSGPKLQEKLQHVHQPDVEEKLSDLLTYIRACLLMEGSMNELINESLILEQTITTYHTKMEIILQDSLNELMMVLYQNNVSI